MSDFTQAVHLAYHCLAFLVGEDATRDQAEAALDHAPKLAVGMSFAVRSAALERFEPAERDPVPYVDYLPTGFVSEHAEAVAP